MRTRGAAWAAVLAAALSAVGCLKVKCTIRLNEDGSGEVRETIEVSYKLLTLEKQVDLGFKVADCLSEKAVKARAAHMGPGVKVKTRTLVDTPEGGKRLAVVYSFPEINNLRLCMYPMGREWAKHNLRFSSGVSSQEGWNLCSLVVIFDNFRAVRNNHTRNSIQGLPELELQKIRKLLPIFKDMLEGFELSLRIEIFDIKKWASVQRGWVGGGTPWYVRNGGRITLFHITDGTLNSSDDALMAVIPWRQEGAENAITGLVGFPLLRPGNGGVAGFSWGYTQFPTWREYH